MCNYVCACLHECTSTLVTGSKKLYCSDCSAFLDSNISDGRFFFYKMYPTPLSAIVLAFLYMFTTSCAPTWATAAPQHVQTDKHDEQLHTHFVAMYTHFVDSLEDLHRLALSSKSPSLFHRLCKCVPREAVPAEIKAKLFPCWHPISVLVKS